MIGYPHHGDSIQQGDLREDKTGLWKGRRPRAIISARAKQLHPGWLGHGNISVPGAAAAGAQNTGAAGLEAGQSMNGCGRWEVTSSGL